MEILCEIELIIIFLEEEAYFFVYFCGHAHVF